MGDRIRHHASVEKVYLRGISVAAPVLEYDVIEVGSDDCPVFLEPLEQDCLPSLCVSIELDVCVSREDVCHAEELGLLQVLAEAPRDLLPDWGVLQVEVFEPVGNALLLLVAFLGVPGRKELIQVKAAALTRKESRA
jgi:hypothetical protein